VISVPTKLPCTMLLELLFARAIPRLFAEMMLRASTVVPPMRAFEMLPPLVTPTNAFPKVRVPVTSVPIKLPCTVLPEPPPSAMP
jgi:hypothetical protein